MGNAKENMKNTKNFSTSFSVKKSPHEVFKAVTNVRGWWSQNIQGDTEKQGDEFIFEVPGIHFSRQKLVEVIPDHRVVWLVTEADMPFLKDRSEWVNTKVIFDIANDNGKTKLTFTHEGLVPQLECYNACMPAWTQYIEHSLYRLVTTGEGDYGRNVPANTCHASSDFATRLRIM